MRLLRLERQVRRKRLRVQKLGAMQPCQSFEMSLSPGCQSNLHLPAVLAAHFAVDQPELLATRYERNGAMVMSLQSLRELAHRGPFTPRVSFDVQHQEILQWRDAFVADDFFAEAQ